MNQLDFGISNLSDIFDRVNKKLIGQSSDHIKGVNRFLNASGKKYRPILVIMVVYFNGKKIDDRVINVAAAVELVHLASLIHDDIMDEGTVRWGMPTINSKEGVNSAILAGDYLLAKGCALASSVSIEAGTVIAETIAGLCIGQAIELNDNYNTERSVESYVYAAKGKTSSVFTASCVLGGLLAGLNKFQLNVLSEFGENFGVYYQLMDDVSDFVSTPEATGKSVGNDMREGNYTIPILKSLKGPNKEELKKLLASKNINSAHILNILKKDGSISYTINEANKYKNKALKSLDKLTNKEIAKALKLFTVKVINPQDKVYLKH